ncbi:permease, partial [Escherichia coli]|nr:permease [Escherichia coli]MDT1628358.1 permease [Escherichia coli]
SLKTSIKTITYLSDIGCLEIQGASLLNPIIVGLMWVTFGWKVTLLYAIIAAGVSVLASIILDSLGFERHIIASKSSSANCCAPAKTSPGTTYTPIEVSCCSPTAKAIEKPVVNCCNTKAVVSINPIKLATKDALQQFKDVLPYLLLGVLIGSFIYGFIPSEWIAAHAGADNPFAIPLSAVVGIPLYIRAEAVIPLASVLMTKGMGLGALMALIIGSAGASLTEVILLKSMFRIPMIVAFLTVILGMAILMGYLTQMLF